MVVFGGDSGFKQFKGVLLDQNIEFKFENIIGLPSELEIPEREGSLLSDLVINYDGATYYVGEKAKSHATSHRYTFLADKINTIDEKVKFLTALGILNYHEVSKIDTFVTGVPVEEYHIVKDQIKKELENQTFSYTFRGEKMKSHIGRVEVIPQGAGDYYDYILSPNGEIYSDRITPKTLVINIGYRTTELVTLNNGKFSRSESTTLYTATNTFHKELIRLIVKEYGCKKNLTQIDEIYRTGQLYHQGSTYDITPLKQRAIAYHIESILGEIPVWVNLDDIYNILLTGGGCEGVSQILSNFVGCKIDQISKPEYGNANGFYKYGRLLTNE